MRQDLDNQTVDSYNTLKAAGIPVKEAVFKDKTVKSWLGTPEWAFYQDEAKLKKSRSATMWLCPGVLLCEQEKGFRVIVPLANVAHAVLL